MIQSKIVAYLRTFIEVFVVVSTAQLAVLIT